MYKPPCRTDALQKASYILCTSSDTQREQECYKIKGAVKEISRAAMKPSQETDKHETEDVGEASAACCMKPPHVAAVSCW